MGQRIVLIGGSSGIGLAAAREAVARGAQVVIGGRTLLRLEKAARSIGSNVDFYQLDATQEAETVRFFSQVGNFDHLAVLVPSAPDKALSGKLVPFRKMESDAFATVFHNRFWTQCYGVRHGLPHMSDEGSIVFMSSIQPRKAIPNYSASCAASGAIESLARILALELAPIRVNVISPGFVETPGTDQIPTERRAAWERITAIQPVKRLGTAEEIAAGMLFLMENRFTTGAVLDIDGGYRLI